MGRPSRFVSPANPVCVSDSSVCVTHEPGLICYRLLYPPRALLTPRRVMHRPTLGSVKTLDLLVGGTVGCWDNAVR